MHDTWEYGLIHLVRVKAPTEDRSDEKIWWLALVETRVGPTTYKYESLLKIYNELGADGWLVGGPDHREVQVGNSAVKVPSGVWQAIIDELGAAWPVGRYEVRMMQRRIPWSGDAPSEAGGA